MKTKLLKKVRKRFEITHMPKGFSSCGERYEYNLFKLTDSTNSFYELCAQLGRKDSNIQYAPDHRIFETENECIYYLKQCIINRLRGEGYRGRKDYNLSKSHTKVWYK